MTSFLPAVFSSILLGLSFSSFDLWPLSWVALVPLLAGLENKPLGFCLRAGFLAGVIFWSICLWWLVHVTLLGQAVLILYLALYFFLFCAAVYFSRFLSGVVLLFFLPCAWVLLEYLRSYLFTGLPWALLAFSQYRNLPLIQVADITGAWGVSFLVILINTALFLFWRKRLTVKAVCAAGLILLASLGYGLMKLNRPPVCPDEKIRISVIQGNIAQELKWDRSQTDFIQNRYEELTREASGGKAQLVIWPEAAVPGLWGKDEPEFIRIFSLARQLKLELLIGTVSFSGGDYFNSALFVNAAGEPGGIYHKLHRVPFGEYIPLKNIFPFLETIAPIGDITPGNEYTLFPGPVQYPVDNERPVRASARFGVLICFEDLFPELSRQFVKKGARFLVNITNDAWYKQSSAPYQHLAASVLRAVENRVYLARAANTGISGVIQPSGRIIVFGDKQGKEIFVPGYLTADICAAVLPPTLYNRWGDFFILFCLIFEAAIGILYLKKVGFFKRI